MKEKDLIDLIVHDGTKEILHISEFLPDGESDETNIRSVVIPDSVTRIGEYAFHNCWYLESVMIGNSVTSIGDHAFYGCESLVSINVSENNECYQSMDGNLYSKDGETLIKYMEGKTNTSFLIPDSVKSIGGWAFECCDKLTEMTIPDSVMRIGESAFYRCRRLAEVTIPDSVTCIGYHVFYGCDSLVSINVSKKNECYQSMDGNLYSKDGKTLIKYMKGKTNTSFSIPDSVKSISNDAFFRCSKLTSVTIPDSVTRIGKDAFYDCWNLESVTIPNSVTSIDNKAFMWCDKLTISCSKGSYAEQYAKSNGIKVTIVPKTEQAAVKPDETAKTAKKKSCHL